MIADLIATPLVRGVIIGLALLGIVVLFQGPGAPQTSLWRPAAAGADAPSAPLVGRGQPGVAEDVPFGNPLRSPNTVMTQGYGVGSHAPAETWGAIDLALGPNGYATPGDSDGAPIYTTHSGTVRITPNSYPAGNHVWVIGERYKTGYAHLKGFAPGLVDGQQVRRGDLIGYIGSTGSSSGPHLDYQVWRDGVNVNPLDYNPFEGVRR
jgi:murein DD-endopeptidase MepM/ murein hydrolase activator NlpD